MSTLGYRLCNNACSSAWSALECIAHHYEEFHAVSAGFGLGWHALFVSWMDEFPEVFTLRNVILRDKEESPRYSAYSVLIIILRAEFNGANGCAANLHFLNCLENCQEPFERCVTGEHLARVGSTHCTW